MNYGPNVAVPVFHFLTEDAIDLAAFAQTIGALKTAGLRIPACHVYDVSGIPEPKDDDELLGDYDVDVSGLDENGEPAAEGEEPELGNEKPPVKPAKKPAKKPAVKPDAKKPAKPAGKSG
jgi:phage gp29-like protein